MQLSLTLRISFSMAPIRLCAVLLGAVLLTGCKAGNFDAPIACNSCAEWNQPQAPFRVHADTYYVGVAGLSAILIDTGDGLVLIDGGLPQSAKLIDENIRELGFSSRDIKRILVSHVHYDHVGGIAGLQRLSQAPVLTSYVAAVALRNGILEKDDPQYSVENANARFPGSQSVRVVEDGELVKIGSAEIVSIYTPGHTPGGMSWAWRSCDVDQCVDIVFADSLSAISRDGYKFGAEAGGAEQAIRDSAARIAALPCDIFLSNHPFLFDMKGKLAALGEANPFIEKGKCKEYAENSVTSLQRRLATEQKPKE